MAAIRGVDVVVHAAAERNSAAKYSIKATVQGTRNVLEACRKNRVQKLIYISSCAVYEVAGYAENQIVPEEAQLERFPSRRGHYSAAKLQAEILVTEAMNRGECPAVVLRPGTLYGPGAEAFTPMMGVSCARRIFIVFGNGDSELPLVHVDNVVDAILKCIVNSAADNQIFNVVDDERVTKRLYMDRVVKPLWPRAIVIYCPMSVLLTLTRLQEKLCGFVGKQSVLTVYRLESSQKRVRYSASKIQNAMGWRSKIGFEEGAAQMIGEPGKTSRAE
jgi:nucleoside-diphosphate-sugar epimerase